MDLIPIEEKITEIHNAELLQITQRIVAIGVTIRKQFYYIAALLAEVDKKQLYIEDGFKNTVDYAMKVFNLRKTDAYNLISIGKEYTSMEKNASNLPRDDPGKDFTKSQVVAMLPLGHRTAADLCKAGTITPESSARKIKEVVRNNRAANAIINNEPDEEPAPGEDFERWLVVCYNDETGNVERVETRGDIPLHIMDAINEYLEAQGAL